MVYAQNDLLNDLANLTSLILDGKVNVELMRL